MYNLGEVSHVTYKRDREYCIIIVLFWIRNIIFAVRVYAMSTILVILLCCVGYVSSIGQII